MRLLFGVGDSGNVRGTTADGHWTRSRWVGNVTEYTVENVIIDNYFFGVAAVDREGHESLVAFPR